MGYVCLRTMRVNGAVVQPGDQIATATVDGWLTRDAYLNDGSIRYVADAQIAQFITDYAASGQRGPGHGNVRFDEIVARPDRSIQSQRVGTGSHKEVR